MPDHNIRYRNSGVVRQPSVERLVLQVATIRSDFLQGMQAGEAAVGIGLRVNLDHDSAARSWAAILSRFRTRKFTIQTLCASPK
jgi:hypothetical protein